MENELSNIKIGVIATALAYGGMLIAPVEESKMFLSKAQNAVEKLNLPKLRHKLNFTYGLYYELSSSMAMFKKYSNMLLESTYIQGINGFSYMSALMKLHRYYSISGDKKATLHMSTYLRHKCRPVLTSSTVYSSLIEIYDSDSALYSGEHSKIYEFIEKLDYTDLGTLPPFISSNLMAYRALIKAMEFDVGAIELADQAHNSAKESNMTDFHLCRFIFYKGACLTILGMHNEAKVSLEKAIETAQNEGHDAIATSAAAYLSYLFDSTGYKESSTEYAVMAVKYMLKNRHAKFLWAQPVILQNILRKGYTDDALKDDLSGFVFKEYDMCYSTNGELIPVMMINSLGEIELKLGEAVLQSDQLAGNFRLMMGILLSSVNHTMHQEKIQSYIWPNSNKDHARKSFDNLMSRFRKIITDSFYGVNPKEYITISNGIVRLQNVKCSADTFIAECDNADAALKNKDYIRAIECITKIKDTFTDRYFPFISGVESINAKRETTDRAVIKMMRIISDINRMFPDFIPLEKYVAKWMDIFLHETDMVKIAYRFYSEKNDKVKCQRILSKYRDFLASEEFTEEEIEELLFSVKSIH